MSSDNYYLIRKRGERFAVEMFFASDDDAVQPEPAPQAKWFTTLVGALIYANSQDSEYGVSYEGDEI